MAFVGWAFVGFESAGDIAEEVKDPHRAVPKAMVASILVVGVVVLLSGLALILSIPDIGAVLGGESADPVADTIIFHIGEGVVRPLFAMFVFAFLATFVAAQAAAARVLWSFSRDDVMPASGWLKKLSGSARIPARAVIVTGIVPILVVLLSLWGAGYSTLVLFAIAGFYIAFAFPLLALVRERMRGTWKRGVWNLGSIGPVVTVVATLWVLFELVNISWPRDDTAPWYIQWGVVIMVVVLGLLGLLIWATRRDQIRNAEQEIEDDARHEAADPAGEA
jgi:amino acid transporter